MTQTIDPRRVESLGPAERILDTLLTFTDHMVHNRPGVVVADPSQPHGVRWSPATWKMVDGDKVYFRLDKRGKKTVETRLSGTVDYRKPGLFPEVAAWLYRQIAEVWKLDNEFVAHWASWAFTQDHRDLKVALAAFMLVQSRSGEPVREHGEVIFHDEDHRVVGEAMCLIRRKDGKDINPKLLLRVGDLLSLDVIAAINRELGFGRSARNPAMGRYVKVVDKWLRHREQNPKMLQGLVKAGYRRTVMALCRKCGYKPDSPDFFQVLRWRQKQAPDGRRSMGIGADVAQAASWAGLGEAEICEQIIATEPNYKRLVGMLPKEIGLTRAILAAAIEAGSLSDSDLVILTPTLEDLGLLAIDAIGDRWMAACEAAENQRAANIAERVKGRATADKLQGAADRAVRKAVAQEVRGLKVYVAVDVSASMNEAITRAKSYLSRFLQGFPLDNLVVCIFNTQARRVDIKHPSAAGVTHAFKSFSAGGGTLHQSAVTDVFSAHPPADDEDALMFWVGDQQQSGDLAGAVRDSGLRPVAFGFLHVAGNMGARHAAVEGTATALGIPCFRLSEDMFADVYAVPRTLRNLIAATPVGKRTQAPRESLIKVILGTRLLTKPVWA